jgi:hypothetical protein
MAKDKKKKKKSSYVDDGRTIADMSMLYGKAGSNENRSSAPRGAFSFRPGHTPKDWAKTYWEAVKLNLIPMFVTIGIICAAFGILYLVLLLAS